MGSNREETVALAAGRAGILAALVAFAIALAVMPAVLAVALFTAAGLLLSLPLLGAER